MALTKDRKTPYREGIEQDFPVKGLTKIYAGSLVCVSGAGGFAIPAADAAGNIFVGVALEQVDNSAGGDGDKKVKVRRTGVFEFNASSITQAMVGDIMYIVDDETFDETSPGNSVFCGRLVKYESATRGWIDISLAVPVALAAGGALTITDAGGFFPVHTVEDALQKLGQDSQSAQYLIRPSLLRLESGAAIPAYNAGVADGYVQLANKNMGLQWNTSATPGDIMAQFLIPPDLDDAKDLVVHLQGGIVKAGAGEVDSPVFTIEAYFDVPGAAPGADNDCGGESAEFSAAVGANLQEKTLTIAAADVPAAPAVLTLVLHPKDGELGTDDFLLSGLWLEGSRKLLAA